MPVQRKPVIGVMGGHARDDDVEAIAEEVGRRIAEEGWILLNGGRDQGVMAASARGCREAGGFSVGVHPDGPGTADVAPDLDLVVFTGIGFARNVVNVLTADVIVALPGSHGTLSEVAYAQTFGKPTVLLGFKDEGLFGEAVLRTESVDEAITAIRKLLER